MRLIADLDGDGLDEMVITSPWGLGVLKMVAGHPALGGDASQR